jgi:hypothetical protein
MLLDWRGQRDRNQELVAAATGGGRGLAEFSRTDRDIVGTLTTDAFAKPVIAAVRCAHASDARMRD